VEVEEEPSAFSDELAYLSTKNTATKNRNLIKKQTKQCVSQKTICGHDHINNPSQSIVPLFKTHHNLSLVPNNRTHYLINLYNHLL